MLATCDWNSKTVVSLENWGSISVKNLLADSDGRFFELVHHLDEDRKNTLRDLFYAKKKQKIISREPNLLKKVNSQIKTFNVRFRDRVCHECNWSLSTYYRKIREFNYHFVYQEDDTYSNLSNADREMIIKVMSEEYAFLLDRLMKHGI